MMAFRTPEPREWFSRAPELIAPSVGAVNLGVENAVICNVGGCFECLRRRLEFRNAKRALRINGSLGRGLLGKDIVVYKAMVGAPAATLVMETLIASGVRKIVMLGLAGSLTEACEIGDIVVPSWGLREEGTSYHYLPASEAPKPSKRLSDEVVRALGKGGATRGGVWTTDAPYRETRDKIRAYAKSGVVAVEMECTALMSVAMMRKAEFAAALAISDTVHGDTWEEGFHSDDLMKAIPSMSKASVKALRA